MATVMKETETDLSERKSSYEYEDLIKSGHGELFGPENGRLPLPPMLMLVSDALTRRASAIASAPSSPIMLPSRLMLVSDALTRKASTMALAPSLPMWLPLMSMLVSDALTQM